MTAETPHVNVKAETLKSVVGPVAAGPAGFGIHYEVDSGARIDPTTKTVEVKLNEGTLQRARAQNEGGSNKIVADSLHKAAKAESFVASPNRGQNLYANKLNKKGIGGSQSTSSFNMTGTRRFNHRAAMASHKSPQQNPLLAIKQRHLLRLRATFDAIAGLRQKTVAINPNTLMQAAADYREPQNVDLGQQKNKKVARASHASMAQAAKKPDPALKPEASGAYNSAEWARWSDTLMPGSYPTLTARPKAY